MTQIHLDVLSERQALRLLGRLAGPDRVAVEPLQAATLVGLCAQLPLAVCIAGAWLAARPGLAIAALVDTQRRLDELQVGERAVRASFAVSYRALRPATTPSAV